MWRGRGGVGDKTHRRGRDEARAGELDEVGVDVRKVDLCTDRRVGRVDEAELEFDRPRGLGVCSCRDDVQSEWLSL